MYFWTEQIWALKWQILQFTMHFLFQNYGLLQQWLSKDVATNYEARTTASSIACQDALITNYPAAVKRFELLPVI